MTIAANHPKQSRLKEFLITTTVVTLFFVAAWYVISGPAEGCPPSVRPAGVPSDALWVGGADGGAYVRCEVDLARNVDHCELWNDFTGDLAESGDYQIHGQARAATEQELKGFGAPDFAGHIYLINGIVLDRLHSDTANP